MTVPSRPSSAEPSLHFRARHRLTHAREFDAVYAAKVRKVRGAITLFACPNTLGWSRLGLAVSSRIGGAVVRNRWKRLIREAFRLQQHTLPRTDEGMGYDLIVSIRSAPGQPCWPLGASARALAELAGEADREWRRRARRDGPEPGPVAPQQ